MANDPVRDAHTKCLRVLEKLPTDEDRRLVVHSLAIMLRMAPFETLKPGGTP